MRWVAIVLPLFVVAACVGDGALFGSDDAGHDDDDGSGGGGVGSGTGATTNATGSAGNTGTGGGTGGSGGAGTGGGATCDEVAECQLQAVPSCTLHDDCCNCIALGPGETAPPCNITSCFVSKCSELHHPSLKYAQCAAGECVAGFNCHHADVLCDGPPPQCGTAETPSVVGNCWGPCVPTNQCLNVGSCDQCTANQACVEYVGGFTAVPVYHCVDLAEDASETCACIGDKVCLAPFDTCADDPSGTLTCNCLGC